MHPLFTLVLPAWRSMPYIFDCSSYLKYPRRVSSVQLLTNSICLTLFFYAPGLKGPPGASSVWIVRPSVRLSVCPSVCPSVHLSVRNSVPLTFKVQYFKFGWSYSNQTWTESPSMDCSHFTDITYPWGWGRVNIWDLEILPYFDFVAAGGIRVSQTHV